MEKKSKCGSRVLGLGFCRAFSISSEVVWLDLDRLMEILVHKIDGRD